MADMPILAVHAFYYFCSVRNWRM